MRADILLALAVTPLLFTEPGPGTAGPADPLLVTPAWLARRMDDPRLVVLDLRDRAEYNRGHIAGARRVDLMAFHAHGAELPSLDHLVHSMQQLGIGNDSRVVLYGDNMVAGTLWLVLEYLGMGERAHVLDGGIQAWSAAGHSLTPETPRWGASTFAPAPQREIIVTAGYVQARLSRPGVVLIDARTEAEYRGNSSDGLESPGHIPGAVSLHYERTFDAGGRHRSAAQLAGLFAEAGYRPGSEVVIYCTVGMRASHLFMVARSIGLSPRIYLGSMADWASDRSRPVAR